MPVRALLISVRDFQNRFLAERLPEQLQPNRKFRVPSARFQVGGRSEAAWDADAANACKVAGNREDVAQIHLQWIIGFFADLECSSRCRRRDNSIDLLERSQEILADERTNFLSAQVIGVVVAAAEHVGPQDDAAFDFGAESRAARLA